MSFTNRKCTNNTVRTYADLIRGIRIAIKNPFPLIRPSIYREPIPNVLINLSPLNVVNIKFC